MTHRIPIVALLLLAGFGVLAPVTAKPAAACVLGRSTLDQIAERAELVIVGEVVSEQPVGPDVPDVYTSTVTVSATLKGEPEGEFTLDGLGHLFEDCSGGPRLAAGERVLLFLNNYRGQLRNYRGQLQVTSYQQGKYALAGGEARTAEAAPVPVEDFLQRVAAMTGAEPDQLDAAMAFVRGETAPAPLPEVEPVPTVADEDGSSSALLIAISAAAATVLLAALLFAARRLRRES